MSDPLPFSYTIFLANLPNAAALPPVGKVAIFETGKTTTSYFDPSTAPIHTTGSITTTDVLTSGKNFSTSSGANVSGLSVGGGQSAASSGGLIGASIAPFYASGAGTLAQLIGLSSTPANTNAGNITVLYGGGDIPNNTSTGTVGTMIGHLSQPTQSGTGLVTAMYGYQSQPTTSSAGNITNAYAYYADGFATGAGVITNYYGLYLDYNAGQVANLTNVFGVAQIDPRAINVFNGPTYLGTAGLSTGELIFRGTTSGAIGLTTSATPGTEIITIPNLREAETLALRPQVFTTVIATVVGTTSTTGLMMGLAGAITPQVTGRIMITISGDITNSAANDGAAVQIRTGTGAAPGNGTALAGVVGGGLVKYTPAVNSYRVPFTLNCIVSGLTLGTAIWIDVGLAAITGGTATIADVSISAFEL